MGLFKDFYNGNKKPKTKNMNSYNKDFKKHQDKLNVKTIDLKQTHINDIHNKMIADGWTKEEIHQYK